MRRSSLLALLLPLALVSCGGGGTGGQIPQMDLVDDAPGNPDGEVPADVPGPEDGSPPRDGGGGDAGHAELVSDVTSDSVLPADGAGDTGDGTAPDGQGDVAGDLCPGPGCPPPDEPPPSFGLTVAGGTVSGGGASVSCVLSAAFPSWTVTGDSITIELGFTP
ncbi:MAG: hypothetical protein FJ098_07815 [Deltaproteobacteria bacterium]|nr:hypothetical protein [Deltaproteobacteria bacterium]